jgi:SAM-dependent methyltransferase
MLPSQIEWIDEIRRYELDLVLARAGIPPCDLLEIGGGSGQQAALLADRGFRVRSIDIASSGYAQARLFPVQDYDGRRIPFADRSFDVVFSSNVLEHIAALDDFEGEIRRVLRPGGRAIHILPNHRWRAWTWAAHYPAVPLIAWARLRGRGATAAAGDAGAATTASRSLLMRALVPPRHGERGNAVTEYAYFHPRWWKRHFRATGWQIADSFDVPLLYTGYALGGRSVPLRLRGRMAAFIGGVSTCYALRDRVGS